MTEELTGKAQASQCTTDGTSNSAENLIMKAAADAAAKAASTSIIQDTITAVTRMSTDQELGVAAVCRFVIATVLVKAADAVLGETVAASASNTIRTSFRFIGRMGSECHNVFSSC